ncbi:hypothetical protein JCM16358_12430 [Halanaerocella petrolearia]
MSKAFTIQNLTNFFNLEQHEIQAELQQFANQNQNSVHYKDNQYLITEPGIKKFRNFLNQEIMITNHNLLEYIICYAIEELSFKEENNFIFQYTKRTRVEQQRDYNEFQKLPDIVQQKYYGFADNILTWLKEDYISDKLTKMIVDRLPEDKRQDNHINLRITLYEGNHLSDLNLKITNRVNNLKQISSQQLVNNLQTIPEVKSEANKLITESHCELLNKLQQLLNEINHKRTVQRIFKWLIGYSPYYLIIAEPEVIIADFTELKLPTEVHVSCQDQQLLANFDNNCHLVAQVTTTEEEPKLNINFQNLPNQLNLLSF